MTSSELAAKLKSLYNDPSLKKSTAVHLFGIRYADQLSVHSVEEIVAEAGISKSYGTEVRKGIRLAAYVIEK